MHNAHTYKTQLTWTGAAAGPTSSYTAYSRDYVVRAPGKEPITGSADQVFRGNRQLYNPEEMLVASLSGCHMLSYLAEAARAGVHVTAYEDSASGIMVVEGSGGRFTEVTLRPHVTISVGDSELAQELHERAHKNCFVASSMNFPVKHQARITVA